MKTKSTSQTPRTLARNAILLAITALALSASPPSWAAADCVLLASWDNPGAGDWFNPLNWGPNHNQVPDCGQCCQYPWEADINNGGTAQISTPTPTAYVCELFLGKDNSMQSGTLSVNHGTMQTCNESFIGYHGKGTLSIKNGGVVTTLPVGASIASLTGSNGTVTVDGQNPQDHRKSQWTVTGPIYLGGTINAAGGIGLLTVTNNATVAATSIQVYPSGTLTGNSSVSTTNGTTVQGTISRSTGTLNIGGNLTISGSAATMQCSVTPQDPNNIDISVSGTATLSGRVSVTMTGTFTPGTQFTLLHANGGVSGTFTTQSITKPNTPCFTPLIRYDANNVYLYLQPCT
jgi:T5SS/PEP-CTERM-associated repeat protein